MTYEAPKLATLVDDFRTYQLNSLLWSKTGTVTMNPTDSATTMRGLIIQAGGSVTSVNTTPARRFDLWDSEIVWVVGKWATPTLVTFAILQSGGQYGYRFEYLNGVLTVKSIEAGVTYTGANFLNGTGGTVNWGQTLKYLRIAHNASTGRVEFYAGTNPDGSDQRLMTSDLGSGSKGTLTPTQSQIDNMAVTMSTAASASISTFVRAVNAPFGGLRRGTADDPAIWLYRDFNSWVGYLTNRFSTTVNTMSHEWYVNQAYSANPIEVSDISVTDRVMKLQGNGVAAPGGGTVVHTAFASGIRDVSFEAEITPLAFADSNNFIGMFWRNQSFMPGYGNSANGTRYQLNIYQSKLALVVHSNNQASFGAGSNPTSILLETVTPFEKGTKYKFRVNHFGNKIVVYVNGTEVMSTTDLNNWLRSPGQVGFQAANAVSGATGLTRFAVHNVKVTSAYDETQLGTGISLQDRGLGIHVRTGARDGSQTTMSTDPSLVSKAEAQYGVPFKTVYHYSDPTVTNGAVDTALIGAARQHGIEGRTNIITVNAFRPDVTTGVNSFYYTQLKAWSDALNTIPGSVYVCMLPFPNLNTYWSPWSYTSANITAASGHSTTTLTNSTGTWAVNQWAGAKVRFQDTAGIMYWGSVTSNTTTVLTFTQSTSGVPGNTLPFFLDNSNGLSGNTSYINTYRNFVSYMKSQGCKAKFLWALNWQSEIFWQEPGAASLVDSKGYPAFTSIYPMFPGADYVDGYLIRAINQGQVNPDMDADAWRPLNKMLLGGAPTTKAYWAPGTQDSPYSMARYLKQIVGSAQTPIFVVGGSYETHNRYNDFSAGGFINEPITAMPGTTTDGFNGFTNASGLATVWAPSALSQFNPRSSNLDQRGIRSVFTTTGQNYFLQWNLPASGVNVVSASCYVRVDSIGSANSSALVMAICNSSNQVIYGFRVDQSTGALFLLSGNVAKTDAGSATGGAALTAGVWYRLDLTITNNTRMKWSMTSIDNQDQDRPIVGWSSGTTFTGTVPSYVEFGSNLSSTTNTILNGMELQDCKVSWDTTAMTFSKSAWISDALNTRSLPDVTGLILMSGDNINDVPRLNAGSTIAGSTTSTTALAWKTLTQTSGGNSGDLRLDGSKHSAPLIASALVVPNAARIHTNPQPSEVGYQTTSKVGELEYMYLEEVGYAPLYLTPRAGGILLRDFSFGQGAIRAAQEERPGTDGVRDYSRYVGPKAVSLSFVLFEDKAGSAAYYADVIAAWANVRRRPRLVYKMKDGVERRIRLRPEGTDAAWTVDGVRAGFKESVLSFVGIDGKDFATEIKTVLMRQATMTQVNTPGTANTPPRIRIYGGSTGCLNPTIILQSLEQEEGDAAARISLGNSNSSCFIPANQFLEIDMNERTVQLNGLPGQGNSYLRYLSDRQWFDLEPYYNTLYLETDDGNGFAALFYSDAYL